MNKQLENIENYGQQAIYATFALTGSRNGEILNLARGRAAQYEDLSHLTRDELRNKTLQLLAEAVLIQATYREKEDHARNPR